VSGWRALVGRSGGGGRRDRSPGRAAIARKRLPDLNDNVAAFDKLVKQAISPVGIVPFVGAGLSVPFGFPEWGRFLADLAPNDRCRAEVAKLLANGEFEEAAGAILREKGEESFQLRFSDDFAHEAGGARGTHDAAVRYLPAIARGPVITTNFDRVLETVFKQAGRPFQDVVWGAKVDQTRDALRRNERTLIKLHGDAVERADRVITAADYARQYGPEGRLRDVFGALFSRPLLFVGCSLAGDRIVRQLEANRVSTHFAIVEWPESPEAVEQRNRRLEELQIFPIYYPRGEHGWVASILGEIASRVTPTLPRRLMLGTGALALVGVVAVVALGHARGAARRQSTPPVSAVVVAPPPLPPDCSRSAKEIASLIDGAGKGSLLAAELCRPDAQCALAPLEEALSTASPDKVEQLGQALRDLSRCQNVGKKLVCSTLMNVMGNGSGGRYAFTAQEEAIKVMRALCCGVPIPRRHVTGALDAEQVVELNRLVAQPCAGGAE
jgi:hypothetical protein